MQNPSISFELYKIFYHAAATLNFSKAAESMHVTQSAVSQAIKSLETQLGIPLFFRQGRSVSLTHEGEILFAHIEKAFHFIRSAEISMQNIKSLDEGTVFIGASDTITRYFLMDAIKAFHLAYPRVKLSINNRPSPRSVEKLKNGELDLAVINLLPDTDYDGLDGVSLTTLEHIFISSCPVSATPVTLKTLSQHPLVCLEKKSTTRRILEQFFTANDVIWEPAFEFGSFDVILEAVKASMGIGFVPRKIASALIETGELSEVVIREPIPSIEIGIMINKSKPLSLAAKKYLEILKNTGV